MKFETKLTKQIYDSITYIDAEGYPCDYMVESTPEDQQDEGPWCWWLNAFDEDNKLEVELNGDDYTLTFQGKTVFIADEKTCSLIVPGDWIDLLEKAHGDVFTLSLGYSDKAVEHHTEIRRLRRSLGLEEA